MKKICFKRDIFMCSSFAKKQLLILLHLCILSLSAWAQEDFNFTQYHNTPMMTNPAMFSIGRDINILFNYRTQPNATGQNFTTAMLSGIYPIMNRYSGQKFGAVGLGLLHDQPGSFIRNNGIIGGYAYNFEIPNSRVKRDKESPDSVINEMVRIRRFKHGISVGAQVGYFIRNVSFDGLTTGAQFQGGQFNPGIPLGENAQGLTRGYLTVTPGLMWSMTDTLGKIKASLGISWFNLNTPSTSFYGRGDNLPHHFVVTGNYLAFEKGRVEIIPTFRWVFRSGSNQVNFGVIGRYAISSGAGPKSFIKNGHVSLGLWYNFNNAFVSVVQFEQPKYFVAMNFDLATTVNSTRWQGASVFEITIGFKIPQPLKILPKTDIAPIKDYSAGDIKNFQPTLAIVPIEVPKKPKPKTKKGEEDGAFRFKRNSSELDERSKQLLDSVALVMMEYPDATIDVAGHTCDLGSDEDNMVLSVKRAEALKEYLSKKYEIAPDRIKTTGFGEAKPLVPNTDEDNRAQNRRVAFKVRYGEPSDGVEEDE
ncbi:MAG TPA: hypothetical protein DCM08_00665 [Microscillaceae bacterium]|nr:hypothetical protein [Microscillaceae bacterium]